MFNSDMLMCKVDIEAITLVPFHLAQTTDTCVKGN